MRRFLSVTATLIGLALAGDAQAGLLPISVNVTPADGMYRWTYALTLPTETMLKAGDYFTIYDFAGYQAGSATSPGTWSFSTTPTGPVPPGVIPVDNSYVPNLTWTYNGPTITAGAADLGPFAALSAYEVETQGPFTARTHRTSDGLADSNITTTTIPVPAGPQVPEPGTLALAAVGLPLVGLMRRWRKK